jgi:hypothetical protein
MCCRALILISLIVSWPGRSRADDSVEWSGIVKQQGTRDPLPGIEVIATPREGPAATALTDEAGRFHFGGLLPGSVRVSLRGTAIRLTDLKETLRPGRLSVIYYAAKKSSSFETVVRSRTAHREVIETTLSRDEVRAIAGNQNDVVKAVQNLPGVARAPFGIGQLVVWGSSPSDTRAYADGVLIPRVYHFGGLRSTISAEFVDELRFTPGAYGASYGRGLGGVVEITTRAPRSDRWHGSVTLDLIDGGLTIEGPITKKLHIAAGARLSWISAFLPLLNRSGPQISPFYWDYQLALRYQASSRDDIDLLIFGATSNVTAKVDSTDPNGRVDIDSKSYFGRARLRYTHRFSRDSTLTIMPSLGGDTFTVDTKDTGFGGTPVRLTVRQLGYNLRAELRQKLFTWFSYAAGLDFEGSYAQVETLQPLAPLGGYGGAVPAGGGDTVLSAGRSESTFIGAGFFADSKGPPLLERLDYQLISTAPYVMTSLLLGERVMLSPQLRLSIESVFLENDFHSDATSGAPSYTRVFFEPRLATRFTLLPERLFLVGALGAYHQAPQGAELSPRFGNPYLQWQTGTTYTLGFESNLAQGLHLSAQGFYKDLRNLVVSDVEKNFDNDGLGRVYGGELLLRQAPWRGLSGWVAYTLSRSERRNQAGEPWRVYQFDQTHILTLIASYKLPVGGVMFGVRFRYVTGNPTTPYVGGVRDTSSQGYYAVIGEPSSVRLPDFHQLDVRIDKTFTFNRWRLGMYLEVQNLYNRHNAESLIYGGRQLYQQGNVTGLPIFPNLGFRADF